MPLNQQVIFYYLIKIIHLIHRIDLEQLLIKIRIKKKFKQILGM
jgi:hypothetical protein